MVRAFTIRSLLTGSKGTLLAHRHSNRLAEGRSYRDDWQEDAGAVRPDATQLTAAWGRGGMFLHRGPWGRSVHWFTALTLCPECCTITTKSHSSKSNDAIIKSDKVSKDESHQFDWYLSIKSQSIWYRTSLYVNVQQRRGLKVHVGKKVWDETRLWV